MPQDSLRSAVYRSFLTCDDPKGVECGAIRKQKKNKSSSRRTEHKAETEKGKEKIELSKRIINEEITSNHNASSLQLLRVSKGVQKLNNILESWSNGIIYEGQSKDVAKDLLIGALDLEESLAMLQEASKANLTEKVRTNGVRIQRSVSERFEARNRDKGFEKPRISADGSSRDCYEELRKVIKESFVRQNLLADSIDEKTRFCRSNIASSSGIGSTSSSQSTTVYGNDSGSTKSSLSWEDPPKNHSKGPSLIAKLMGLEEFHSTPAKSTNLEIGKPEPMKKEIIETVQFKDFCSQTSELHHNAIWHHEERPVDNAAPIVLIKALDVPHQLRQFQEEKPRGRISGLRKPRAHIEIHPRKIDQRKEATTSNRLSKKLKASLGLNKPDKDLKETVTKAKAKEARLEQTASGNTRYSGLATIKRPQKVEKSPKPTAVSKKIKERYEGKLRKMPPKPKKSENGSDSAKDKTTDVKGSHLNSKLKNEQTRSRRQQEKTANKPATSRAKKRLCKDDKKGNDLIDEIKSVSSGDSSESGNQPPSMEETCEFQIEESFNSRERSCFDSTALSSEDKKDLETSTDSKIKNTGITLNSFLLNAPNFLAYAEQLFDLDTNTTTSSVPCSKKSKSFIISDQRLSLDCAKELIKHKTLLKNFRIRISLDQLLLEVCEGFEALAVYNDLFSGEICVTDSVNVMLERELSVGGNKMGSGIWGLGWRNGFWVEEDDNENVVSALERLILTGLIEEIFS